MADPKLPVYIATGNAYKSIAVSYQNGLAALANQEQAVKTATEFANNALSTVEAYALDPNFVQAVYNNKLLQYATAIRAVMFWQDKVNSTTQQLILGQALRDGMLVQVQAAAAALAADPTP